MTGTNFETSREMLELEKIAKRAKARKKDLAASQVWKTTDYFFFSLWFGYFVFFHALFGLLKKLGVSGDNLDIWFIRHYFKKYFRSKGLDHYLVHDIPSTFEKPSVIFTLRDSFFSTLFTWTLIPTPTIVPLSSNFDQYRACNYFKWSFLGKKLKKIAYPDQELPVNIKSIQTLLKKGYSVVVHINEGYADPEFNRILRIHKEVTALLKDPDRCFFLRVRDWENYKTTTTESRNLLSCDFMSLNEIVKIDKNRPLFQAISEFFEYTKKEIL